MQCCYPKAEVRRTGSGHPLHAKSQPTTMTNSHETFWSQWIPLVWAGLVPPQATRPGGLVGQRESGWPHWNAPVATGHCICQLTSSQMCIVDASLRDATKAGCLQQAPFKSDFLKCPKQKLVCFHLLSCFKLSFQTSIGHRKQNVL